MSRKTRLGDGFEQLETRELPVVNPLAALPGGETVYDAHEVRFIQEVSDVRTRLSALQLGTASTDVRLREELGEVLVSAAWLTPLDANDVVFGQPVDVILRTPSLTFQASEEGYGNYVLSFNALQKPLQVLRNGTPVATVAAGTNQLPLHFDAPWYARETLTFKDPSTNQLVGGSLEVGLNMYTNKIAVTNNRLNFGSLAYNESIPLAQKTSSLQAGPVLDGLLAEVQTVWNPTSGSRLTVSELQAAQSRLTVGMTVDAVRLRDVLMTGPGVEAVVTPSFTFESGFNNQGRQVFAVNAENIPAGGRFVMASDPWLKQVLDERSFLPGKNRGEFTWQPGAAYTGLVSENGDLLGQAFRLSIVDNWLIISQGQQTVGQPGFSFAPVSFTGVSVPLTKDSLTAVSPQARLVVAGSSADLRFEWLPAGAIIEGLTATPIVAAGGSLNVPVFVANGTQRAVTVRSADGAVLMEKHMVGSNGSGGFVFYRWSATAEPPKLVNSVTFGLAQLATREDTRAVEAGRSSLASRPNPVFPAGSTVANQAWGLNVAGMTGIDLALSRSDIARQHSPLVALWEENRDGFYAEVQRRYDATPVQNGRKMETAGMIESRMKGEVFDAYARADEAIHNALPVLGDLTVAAYLNVQATRTDAPLPPNLASVRTFTVQARNAAALLPSDQELLTAIGARFDQVRAYLAGEVQNWRNEVNEASLAGRITKDPNPGLRLPPAPQLTAYESALTAVSEAERNYRLAVAANEPRRLSAAKVSLATAQATLVKAEAAYRAWQRGQQSAPDAKPVSLEGQEVFTLSKSALERVLAGLPQKITSVDARLAAATDPRLRQDLVAERAHWLALQQAAFGLLTLVPQNGTYPVIVGTQAQAWARYVGESVSGGLVQNFQVDGLGGSDAYRVLQASDLLTRSFTNGVPMQEARDAARQLANQELTKAQLQAQMLSWKPAQNDLLPLLNDVSQATYAGKFLVTVITQMWENRSFPQSQWDLAFRLQILTDIPASRMFNAIAAGSSLQVANDFKAILRDAHFDHLFSSTPEGLVAFSDKPQYQPGDSAIRIRFDLDAGGGGIQNVRISSPEGTLLAGARDSGFILLPIAALPLLESETPADGSGEFSGYDHYTLRVEVILANGRTQAVEIEVSVKRGLVADLRDGIIDGGQKMSLDPSRLVENFSALPVAEQQKILESLQFDVSQNERVNDVMAGILQRFFGPEATDEHRIVWNSTTVNWIGTAYSSYQEGQCKYWLDEIVLLPLGVLIGSNITVDNETYSWASTQDVEPIVTGHSIADYSTLGSRLQQMSANGDLKTGDMIQYSFGDDGLHTVMIGARSEAGVWVIESNYVSLTPGYRFLSWEDLNETKKYTVYRITPNL